MRSETQKLVAIGLYKPSPSGLLHQCEELLMYGILSQAARLTNVQYKDLATVSDKVEPQWLHACDALYTRDSLNKLKQICQSTRTQFLLTGVLQQSAEIKSELHIEISLYSLAQDVIVFTDNTVLSLDTENIGDGGDPEIPVDELNRVINSVVYQILKTLEPETICHRPKDLPVASNSLSAIKLILKAHHVSNNTEKIALYESALREDPAMETAYYHLARCFRSEYELEKSVIFYREALKISRASARNKAIYATEAGVGCALLGKNAVALQWWNKAIEYDPGYINPYFNIANTQEDLGNYPAAEEYFLKAQELAPDDFRTFLNLARIYSKLGQWDKALNQYQFQLKSEANDPWCHSDLATCYLNLGEVENAKRHLEKTVALDPEGEAGEYAQLILGGLG
ncbi:tetratricopeptide repeat protein [Vampirovibrio chlorellavorus]|uniref:tetratricopeptide repeat protein n=1 Tax=Vampirovibrio chlorellavorus TaxID=758823 RepID=UPI0026EA834A|nr:tetratricopeptide repeat protein [Vampirovibrio chlorellavorus]